MIETETNQKVVKSIRNASDKWNGFSYQGKVGLLIGLRSLMDHYSLTEDELNDWYFEYEVSEDVAVANKSGIVSKHQIKAKSTSTSHFMSAYKSAIAEFEIEDTPEDQRYLHTAVEVTDFKTNDNKVVLYEYPNGDKYCELANDQIFIHCRNEIIKIRPGIGNEYAENIAYFLLHQVSALINESHDSLVGDGKIQPARMSLAQLKYYIHNSSADNIVALSDGARLKNALSNIWDDHLGGDPLIDLKEFQKMHNLMKLVSKLSYTGLIDFLSFIHPEINFVRYGNSINIYGFKDVFLESLIKCSHDYNFEGSFFNVNGQYFIPTTINRSNTPKNKEDVAKGIINNYNSDSKRLLFEKSSIINESIDGDLLELAGVTIRKYPEAPNGLEHIMGYSGSRLINVSDAIDSMNRVNGK
ncbi:hypothetical protein I8H83_03315 [Candidatus Saccharibacteria bacterium]|nr:hypothetical protein [Candidatus Saccharibacteria bacterium]